MAAVIRPVAVFRIKSITFITKSTGRRIKNMKFVKPRYNSAVCLLGRSILFMEAEIGLAVELSVVRSGDEPARVCQNFLAEINAEKYVQAGMMADAGDEALQLARRHFFITFQKRV